MKYVYSDKIRGMVKHSYYNYMGNKKKWIEIKDIMEFETDIGETN